MNDLPPLQQFLSRFDEDDNGCWIWQGKPNNYGYGRFRIDQHINYIHRLSYEIFIGPIPEGLQLDHLCRVRMCGNPDHLEAVDQRTNLLRGNGFAGIAARKTHCLRGHLFDEANTRMKKDGTRCCRACDSTWRQRNEQR